MLKREKGCNWVVAVGWVCSEGEGLGGSCGVRGRGVGGQVRG